MHTSYRSATVLLLLAGLLGATPHPVPYDPVTQTLGVYIYPRNGQTASQQSKSESDCYHSAINQTGVNPAAMAQPTPIPGGAVRGAARGAAGGAVVGGITGDAGAGAAVGSVVGAVRGRRIAAQASQAQNSQKMDNLRRAFSACMDAKGYSVK
jgi:hypothetical protein